MSVMRTEWASNGGGHGGGSVAAANLTNMSLEADDAWGTPEVDDLDQGQGQMMQEEEEEAAGLGSSSPGSGSSPSRSRPGGGGRWEQLPWARGLLEACLCPTHEQHEPPS